MIDELKKQSYYIDVLTDSINKSKAFYLNTNVRHVYVMKKTKGLLSDIKINKDLFNTTLTIGYDKVITTFPHQGIYSVLLMGYLSYGLTVQHEYHFKWFNNISWFLTESFPIIRKNVVELNMDLVNAKKKNIKYNYDNVRLDRDPTKRTIMIHPGCAKSMMWKRWDKWDELIKELAKDKRNNIKIIIGPDESKLTLPHLEECKNVKIIYSKPLRYLLMDMLESNLFISADSGMAHLAALTGIKQITLFGGVDPIYSKPFSKNCYVIEPDNHKIIYTPYQKKRKKGYNQVNRISVETVLKQITLVESKKS